MQKLIILHTNDLHGRIENLTRIATEVDRIRVENDDKDILYVDAGDSQDTSNLLSDLSKGVAMHTLLRVAGCQATTLGNKCMRQYRMGVVVRYAEAMGSPLLLANLLMPDGNPIVGTVPSKLFELGELKLGMISVSTKRATYVRYHRLKVLPAMEAIRREITSLRSQGANAIIILSHMGVFEDQKLAKALQEDVPLIIGGHTHYLLENGQKMGTAYVVQADSYGDYLGRVDMEWDGDTLTVEKCGVMPITNDIPPAPRMLEAIELITAEVQQHWNEH
jgi:2',3'-cyclic-nucleotide 2'-phosphodiesterase (5'-nucleotidase family)